MEVEEIDSVIDHQIEFALRNGPASIRIFRNYLKPVVPKAIPRVRVVLRDDFGHLGIVIDDYDPLNCAIFQCLCCSKQGASTENEYVFGLLYECCRKMY